MTLSSLRIALALSAVACATACTVGATGTDETLGHTSDAISISPLPPPPASPDLIALCSGAPASQSNPLHTGQHIDWAEGGVSAACDYAVFDVTAASAKSFTLRLDDIYPNSITSDALGVKDAADCAKSNAAYEVMGYVPASFHLVGQQIVETPAKWVGLGSWFSAKGNWIAYANGGGRCTLGLADEGMGSGGQYIYTTTSSAYDTVRVAARVATYQGGEEVDLPLYLYVEGH